MACCSSAEACDSSTWASYLFHRHPELRLEARQFFLELYGDRYRAGVERPQVATRILGRRVIAEEHEEETARRIVVAHHRPNYQIDLTRAAVERHRDVLDFDACPLPGALIEGGAEIGAQLREDQPVQVPCRLAAADLKVAAHPRRHVDHGVILGHDQRWRGIFLEEPVVCVERRESFRDPRFDRSHVAWCRAGQLGQDHTARDHPALVEVARAVDWDEQVARAIWRFGRAEHEVTTRPQREVKDFDDAILGGAIQVDQEVPARHEIEVREGRILYQIVVGKQDELAQLASDPVAGGLAVEEARQPRFRDVTHLVVTVESVARRRDRVLVEISGKNLHERLVEARGSLFRK